MAITVEIGNYDAVLGEMRETRKDFAKCVRRAMIDVGTKGVKTAAQKEVRKVYNVSVADVNSRFSYRETGSLSIEGVQIPFFTEEWKQNRTFTPGHKTFRMKPKARKRNNAPYNITFSPLKGGSTTVKSDSGMPVFLASPSGAMLPWFRLGKPRKPIEVVRTHLAIPQMIDNDKVHPGLEKEIENRVDKALRKYLPD